MGIRRFSYNFPKIYSKTRVSELEMRNEVEQAAPTEQAPNEVDLDPCERSELRVWTSQAQSTQTKQTKQIKHGSFKRSEFREPSAVFANQPKQS